jgi:ABC-type branched-subunit amino acid transport system substrate-binding protein
LKRNTIRTTVAAVAMLSLALAGCSAKATGSQDNNTAGGLKTGPGVTDSTITVGSLAVTTGPAAVVGKDVTEGQQLILKQINDAGGVCHRQLKIELRDTAFDPQRAVAAYHELEPSVAGFSQLFGSAPTAALISSVENDKVLTIPAGFSADLLGHQHMQIAGGAYDIDMINSLFWFADKAGLKAGDKVGHVYIAGEGGQNSLDGSKYAANKLGLTIVPQEIAPTATDVTAQVSALKAAGVKAVLITGIPAALASFVGVAAATGFKVPILATAPSFAPPLMATPVAPALENIFIASPLPSVASDLAGVKDFVTKYKAQFPSGTPSQATLIGAVMFNMMVTGLQEACKANDLTRDGITTAFRKVSKFDTGLGTMYDFTDPKKAPSTSTFILQPSKTTIGGLKEIQSATTAPALAEYLASKK